LAERVDSIAALAFALRRPGRLAADRSLGYLSLLALALIAYNPFFNYVGVAIIVIPASVGLIATVIAQPNGLVARAAAFKPLVAVGRISYGLYVWHMLPFWTLRFHHTWVGVALAFALALISFRYIEQPFLRRKRASTPLPLPVPALAPAS
jgi:peptidoglycan/LPS O-acetylase OafA/YrhL